MKTKIISALLILTIMFSAITLFASATEVTVTSGECGENLVWNFNAETGTLSVVGNGDMYDYASVRRPWESLTRNIHSVVFSDGVTSIGSCAFISCSNLSNLIIGNNVKTIGDHAFAYNTSLTEITIPDSVTSIGTESFGYCELLKKITVGSGLECMNATMFTYCFELENITVSSQNAYLSSDKNGVLFNKDKTVLLVYPFGKADTNYAIPDGVTTINTGAFNFSENLISIKAPDSINFIGNNAFYSCVNLTEFSIPKNTVSIGNYAFAGCNITNITLPDSLTNLGYWAFYSCANVATVYIPCSLKIVDTDTFANCTTLTDVYYGGSEEDWNKLEIRSSNEPLLNATIHFNHTHLYNEIIEAETSCNKNGLKSFTCECGHYYTEDIPKIAHTNTDWEYKAGSVFVKICPKCLEEYNSLTAEITLEKNEIQLAANESTTLKANVTDGLSVNIAFSSADENVAKVDNNGCICAVSVGKTIITANIIGTDLSASCRISVTPAVYTSVWIVDGKETFSKVEEGAKINIPEVPEKDGHVFIGWTPEVPATMPSHDLYFTAEFDCVAKSDKYNVSATFSPECFNNDVTLSVNEITADREPGGIYLVSGKTYKQIGIFNINMIGKNGETVQPNTGYLVKIKMPLPEEYQNMTDVVIYHRFVNGGREKLSTSDGTLIVENGFMIFEVSKFSEFEILVRSAEMSISKFPSKLSYNYKESLDLNGIELKITDVDGSVKYVTDTSKITVENFDSAKTGKQTITVKYDNLSCCFDVTVSFAWWQWIIRILLLGFLWY